MSSVAVVKFDGDIGKTLEAGIELIGGFGTLRSPVLIKPNICTISDTSGYACSRVEVVEALIRLIFRQNRRLSVQIVESDSENKFADEAFDKFGYKRLEEKMLDAGFDVSLVNLSHSPTAQVSFDGMYFKDPQLPKILTEAHYVISLAIPKTHNLTFLTGIMKNLFGLLPRKNKSYYHPQIHAIVTDLSRLLQPNLCVVDARMGVEGWNGSRCRRIDTFILGKEPVSVDAVMAKVMGFEPERVRHLVEACQYDLGTLEPSIQGQSIESVKVQFKAPK